MLEMELQEFKINPIYEEVLNNLKTEIGNLEAIVNDPENYIFEEINEHKRQVDLDRESFKYKIDILADGLIQELELYKERFRTEYKTKIDLEYYSGLIESSKKQITEYEKSLSLFSTKKEERYQARIESENVIQKLQPKIKQLKEKLLSNLSIKYEPKQNEMDELFGKLIIKVRFLCTEFK